MVCCIVMSNVIFISSLSLFVVVFEAGLHLNRELVIFYGDAVDRLSKQSMQHSCSNDFGEGFVTRFAQQLNRHLFGKSTLQYKQRIK